MESSDANMFVDHTEMIISAPQPHRVTAAKVDILVPEDCHAVQTTESTEISTSVNFEIPPLATEHTSGESTTPAGQIHQESSQTMISAGSKTQEATSTTAKPVVTKHVTTIYTQRISGKRSKSSDSGNSISSPTRENLESSPVFGSKVPEEASSPTEICSVQFNVAAGVSTTTTTAFSKMFTKTVETSTEVATKERHLSECSISIGAAHNTSHSQETSADHMVEKSSSLKSDDAEDGVGQEVSEDDHVFEESEDTLKSEEDRQVSEYCPGLAIRTLTLEDLQEKKISPEREVALSRAPVTSMTDMSTTSLYLGDTTAQAQTWASSSATSQAGDSLSLPTETAQESFSSTELGTSQMEVSQSSASVTSLASTNNLTSSGQILMQCTEESAAPRKPFFNPIEVERKFSVAGDTEARLRSFGARLHKEKTFTDVYYDNEDYSLIITDCWLRRRNDTWEAKIPLKSEDASALFAPSSQRKEISSEREISAWLVDCLGLESWMRGDPIDLLVQAAGLTEFAKLTTTRRAYTLPSCVVDLDLMDQGLCVGEVEVMAASPEEVPQALQTISGVAKQLADSLGDIRHGRRHHCLRPPSPRFMDPAPLTAASLSSSVVSLSSLTPSRHRHHHRGRQQQRQEEECSGYGDEGFAARCRRWDRLRENGDGDDHDQDKKTDTSYRHAVAQRPSSDQSGISKPLTSTVLSSVQPFTTVGPLHSMLSHTTLMPQHCNTTREEEDDDDDDEEYTVECATCGRELPSMQAYVDHECAAADVLDSPSPIVSSSSALLLSASAVLSCPSAVSSSTSPVRNCSSAALCFPADDRSAASSSASSGLNCPPSVVSLAAGALSSLPTVVSCAYAVSYSSSGKLSSASAVLSSGAASCSTRPSVSPATNMRVSELTSSDTYFPGKAETTASTFVGEILSSLQKMAPGIVLDKIKENEKISTLASEGPYATSLVEAGVSSPPPPFSLSAIESTESAATRRMHSSDSVAQDAVLFSGKIQQHEHSQLAGTLEQKQDYGHSQLTENLNQMLEGRVSEQTPGSTGDFPSKRPCRFVNGGEVDKGKENCVDGNELCQKLDLIDSKDSCGDEGESVRTFLLSPSCTVFTGTDRASEKQTASVTNPFSMAEGDRLQDISTPSMSSASTEVSYSSKDTLSMAHLSTSLPASFDSSSPREEHVHAEGDVRGMECPQPAGGHMSLHTPWPTSCKTLKCPHCNWRYKNQQTLDLHVKEKHEDGADEAPRCHYCVERQPHPRLARGENYSCGYRPYQCTVCDYSTCSKGNLSIHMQSDKHLSNVQAWAGHCGLDSGLTSVFPSTTSVDVFVNGLGQQQATVKRPQEGTVCTSLCPQTVTSSITSAAASATTISSGSAFSRNSRSATVSSSPCTVNLVSKDMDYTVSTETVPGEVSGYHAPLPLGLRMHTASATCKLHVQNKHKSEDLHGGAEDPAVRIPPTFPYPVSLCPRGQPLTVLGVNPPLPTWSQNGHNDPGDADNDSGGLGESTDAAGLYQCCICQLHFTDSLDTMQQHLNRDRTVGDEEEEMNLLVRHGSYTCLLCGYGTSIRANFQLHLQTDKHHHRLQLARHVREGGPANERRLVTFLSTPTPTTPTATKNPDPPAQVRCNACDVTASSIQQLQVHTTQTLHQTNTRVFRFLQLAAARLRFPVGGRRDRCYYRCQPCGHDARTKLAMVRHAMTLSHVQLTQERVATFDPLEVYVALPLKDVEETEDCDGEPGTNQPTRDRLCTTSPTAVTLDPLNATSSSTSTSATTTITSTAASSTTSGYSIRQNGVMPVTAGVHNAHTYTVTAEKTAASSTSAETNLPPDKPARGPVATTPSGSRPLPESKDNRLLCPLCQDECQGLLDLQGHLASAHKVTAEGMQKLLHVVDIPSAVLHPASSQLSQEECADTSDAGMLDTSTSMTSSSGMTSSSIATWLEKADLNWKRLEEEHDRLVAQYEVAETSNHKSEEEAYRCQTCSRTFTAFDEMYAHQKELGHLELKQTPGGPGYLCWKKGCNQYFKTTDTLLTHFKEIHAKKVRKEEQPGSLSCQQCPVVLGNKTSLYLHDLYHKAKAVVQCSVCLCCFKTVEGHKSHLVQEHSDLSETELEELVKSIDVNLEALTNGPGCKQFLVDFLGCEAILDGSDKTVPDYESDQKRLTEHTFQETIEKEKESTVLRGKEVNENIGVLETCVPLAEEKEEVPKKMPSEHQSPEDQITSSATAISGLQDPGRMFRCESCRLSFTKESYLVAHYQTPEHLQGISSSPTLQYPQDSDRPYRCDLYLESFTQKTSLQSHLNSVSHLHKVSKASKQDLSLPAVSVTSVSADLSLPSNMISVASTCNGIHSSESPSINTTGSLSCVNTTHDTSVSTSSGSTSGSRAVSDSSSKKQYKCELCNTWYSQKNNLETHCRSVAHQKRVVQLHELAMNGQLGLSQQLFQTPDSAMSAAAQMQQMQLFVELMQQQQQMSSVSSPSLMLPAVPGLDSIPLLQGLPPILSPSTTSLYSPTTAALASYATAAAREAELVNHALNQSKEKASKQTGQKSEVSKQPTEGPEAKTDTAVSESKGVGTTVKSEPSDETDAGAPPSAPVQLYSTPTVQKSEMSTNTVEASLPLSTKSIDQPSNPMLAASIPGTISRPRGYMGRFKPQLQRNLLENFGFECVMQFNESSQDSKKEEKDEPKREKEAENNENVDRAAERSPDLTGKDTCEEEAGNGTSEGTDEKMKVDIPEINKSTCLLCGREFSSIFVLKAHEEEVHRKLIPINLVEDLGEKFREELERKRFKPEVGPPTSTPTTSVTLTSSSTNTTIAAASSTSTVTTTNSAAAAASSTTDKVNSKANKEEMPPPPPPPPQPPSHYDLSQMMPMLGLMSLPMNLLSLGMQPGGASLMAGLGQDLASGFPLNLGLMDPSLASSQQQTTIVNSQNQKRSRTRISDEQLKVLRAHFDINNSPTEAQISQMSDQTNLPQKVIKHWFRNTLFKERQRNKDSPYNFNNPPSTTINLEEYEKTGKLSAAAVKVEPCEDENSSNVKQEDPVKPEQGEKAPSPHTQTDPPPQDLDESRECETQSRASTPSNAPSMTSTPTCSAPTTPIPVTTPVAGTVEGHAVAMARELATTSQNILTKRANRTRFTDYQVKMLQEYFEQNAYPKDDELVHLSKILGLSPRVIIVWFQNARQKARKSYENQPAAESKDSSSSSSVQKTPGLNYLCKKCGAVFQRYFELIRHQKKPCLSESNNNKPLPTSTDDDSLSSTASLDSSGLCDSLNLSSSLQKETAPAAIVSKAFQCDKCSMSFNRLDLWQEHQKIHDPKNSAFFPPFSTSSAFNMLQTLAGQQETKTLVTSAPTSSTPTSTSTSTVTAQDLHGAVKRKFEQGDEDRDDDQPRDKRLRTTILPEQLDYLYQKYQLDCNPSRKQLEAISQEVGLKKRVVQVWFQNTRARERKGHYRAHQQLIHKRCPFCQALFRTKSAMESHLATKHPEEMAKTEINVDAIPDAPVEPPQPAHAVSGISNSQQAGTLTADLGKLLSPGSSQSYLPLMPSHSLGLSFPPPLALDPVQLSMQHLYEDAYKKYINELSGTTHPPLTSTPKPGPGPEGLTASSSYHDGPAQKPTHPLPSTPAAAEDSDAPLDLSMSVKPKKERPSPHTHSSLNKKSRQTSSSSRLDQTGSHTSFHSQERKSKQSSFGSHDVTPNKISYNFDSKSNSQLDKSGSQSKFENSLSFSLHNSCDSNSSSSLGAPSSSFLQKAGHEHDRNHQENHDISNSSIPSSLNDSYSKDASNTSLSPKPYSSNAINAAQKRYRTQMTSLQVKVMKLLFVDYKTPTMAECELLGREIGLPKRVVQVWFQNARAKEKKSKLAGSKVPLAESEPPKECVLCSFTYSHKFTVQDHVFTRRHIDRVKAHIQAELDSDRDACEPRNMSGMVHLHEVDSRGWEKESVASTSKEQRAQLQQGLNAAALGLTDALSGLGGPMALGSLPGVTDVANSKLQQKNQDSQRSKKSESTASSSKSRNSSSSSSSTSKDHLQQQLLQQAQPSAQQTMELAQMMAMGGLLPGLDPGYLSYMYAGLPTFYPGVPAMPLLQPGLLPGAEQMLAYDPLSFGTPLPLLQIPPQAIKDVSKKAQDTNCTLAHYTQDCKTLADVKALLDTLDAACFVETSVDVGYICKKCQMVYPVREACLTHQTMACYPGGGHGGKTMLKLEQLQYECRVCTEKFSTVAEVQSHCQKASHKGKVGKLGVSVVLPTSNSTLSTSTTAVTPRQTSSPRAATPASSRAASTPGSHSTGSPAVSVDNSAPPAAAPIPPVTASSEEPQESSCAPPVVGESGE